MFRTGWEPSIHHLEATLYGNVGLGSWQPHSIRVEQAPMGVDGQKGPCHEPEEVVVGLLGC